MITRNTDYSIQRLRGLSTDTKPTDVPNGSEFLEMDTGKKFLYSAAGTEWIEQANAIPSGGNDMFVITLRVDGETFTVDKTYAEILAAVENGQIPVVVAPGEDTQTVVFYHQGIFENGARFSAIPYVVDNHVTFEVVTVRPNDTVIVNTDTYPRQP